MKKCPFCAEEIQDEAKVCKHCGRDIVAGASQVQIVEPKRKTSPLAFGCLGLIVLLGMGWCVSLLSPTPPASTQKSTGSVSSTAQSKPVVEAGLPSTPPSKWTGGRAGFSEMDDSPRVVYSLKAENRIEGWLTKTSPTLIARCQENKTELYVQTGMAANPELGLFNKHTVEVRIDERKPVRQTWSASTDDTALFAPRAIALMRQLAAARRLRVRFTPFNASPQTIEFDVRGFDNRVKDIAETCGWVVGST